MRNASFLDYRMPTCLDLPMIETIIVEVPNPAHPYGVRGVGETPIVAAARHDRQRHLPRHRRPHDRAAHVAAGALEGDLGRGLNERRGRLMPVIFIPTQWRDLTGGVSRVEVEGGDVREAVDALELRFPGVKGRLCRGDALAPGLQVCVDDVMTPRGLRRGPAARQRGPFPAGHRRRLTRAGPRPRSPGRPGWRLGAATSGSHAHQT